MNSLVVNADTNLESPLPLCLLLNARSVFNKSKNLIDLLQNLKPDICLISETFETDKRPIKEIFENSNFESYSYHRSGRAPGGGCAIVFNHDRFSVEEIKIEAPEEVETVWALFVPKQALKGWKVNKIAVGSYYISPKSKHKQETIDNIVENIHRIRSKYDNDVRFLIGGDFNKKDFGDVIDSYGALHQVVTQPTRKNSILEILLTDMATFYHPVSTIEPLECDEDKIGEDSDHKIVVFAPKNNIRFKTERKKRIVKTRPLPDSKIFLYEQQVGNFPWEAAFENKTADEQVELFHEVLRHHLDVYFPEKLTKMSNLDKNWMTPELKQLHRQMQREYFKHRRSTKYKSYKRRYKKLKQKSIKNRLKNFVTELKQTAPGKWFSMAKKIGAVENKSSDDVVVDSLKNLSNQEAANAIAQHFAAVSNEYSPMDFSKLPAYLPAPPPPQIDEITVYRGLTSIKKTKSTLPIDIPEKLRKEVAVHLAAPLTIIYNNCLASAVYPSLWKHEWVTPAPKVSNPMGVTDLRKISCTSDYSKLFEKFIKQWVMEDIEKNIDVGQFGGQVGIGTEHMLVCYIDRILQLLDKNPNKSAVIATSLDWAAAFDRQDPTIAIQKFLKMGVRPSLVPLLTNYLSDRKMTVKFNNEVSDIFSLVGGGPQGTLLGGVEYLVNGNDNLDAAEPEDRFKFIDDASLAQLICLASLLVDYDIWSHVPSDVGIDSKFLPLQSLPIQEILDSVCQWSVDNLAKLNTSKCYFMVFSRSNENFSTRLVLNENVLEQKSEAKLLGMWITEDLSWTKNCQEICKKAYSRLSLITKLKYVGVKTEDLAEIYILFIRSIVEYCSVVFHSSLTLEQANKL